MAPSPSIHGFLADPELASEWIYVFLVACVVAVIAFGRAFWCMRRVRLFEDRVTSKISSAPQGYVELEGQARQMACFPMRSPLTGTPCVWWSYAVTRSTTKTRNPKVIRKGESTLPFVLEDSTGRCLVEPEGAFLWGTTGRGRKVDWPWPGEKRSWIPGLRYASYRYVERIIPVDATIYALGEFSTRAVDVDSIDVDQQVKKLLGAWQSDPVTYPLRTVISRKKLNHEELRAASEYARKLAMEMRRETGRREFHRLSKPKDKFFFITTDRQIDLIRSWRRHAILAWTVFSLSGVLAAALFPLMLELVSLASGEFPDLFSKCVHSYDADGQETSVRCD